MHDASAITHPCTAILGGAFDPIHVGHVAMVRWALAQPQVTQVLVVPCWQHPYGKAMAPFADRQAMCTRACAAMPRVTVSDIECELNGVSYTANTVRALQAQQPGARFALLVGADAAASLDNWHDSAWLRANVDVMILPRGPASAIPDVSSTDIRRRCAAGLSIAEDVPAGVSDYLAQRHLYR